MATKLIDVIEIVENTNDFILLEITGERKEVIRTGILDGNEEMVKITKGENHTITWYYTGGRTWSWDWGIRGYTLVSENASRKKKAIVELVQDDLCTSIEDKEQTNLPQSKADIVGRDDTYTLMHWNDEIRRCVHKNGRFYKYVACEELILRELLDRYEEVETVKEYVAPTGCISEVIVGRGRKQ